MKISRAVLKVETGRKYLLEAKLKNWAEEIDGIAEVFKHMSNLPLHSNLCDRLLNLFSEQSEVTGTLFSGRGSLFNCL